MHKCNYALLIHRTNGLFDALDDSRVLPRTDQMPLSCKISSAESADVGQVDIVSEQKSTDIVRFKWKETFRVVFSENLSSIQVRNLLRFF